MAIQFLWMIEPAPVRRHLFFPPTRIVYACCGANWHHLASLHPDECKLIPACPICQRFYEKELTPAASLIHDAIGIPYFDAESKVRQLADWTALRDEEIRSKLCTVLSGMRDAHQQIDALYTGRPRPVAPALCEIAEKDQDYGKSGPTRPIEGAI